MILPALLLALALFLAQTGAVYGHPGGDLTVNRYARIEVSDSELRVFYVIDMAELATYIETSDLMDHTGEVSDVRKEEYAHRQAHALPGGFQLFVDGRPRTLEVRDYRTVLRPTDTGLPTLRLEVTYTADVPAPPYEATFIDSNYSFSLGWREMVVVPGSGVTILRSNVPEEDRSNALRKVPSGLMIDWPQDHEARFATGTGPQRAPAPTTEGDALPALGISLLPMPRLSADMQAPAVAAALAISGALGALHAIAPGHGKSLVAAYVVTSGGTLAQVMLLALALTFTHTALVYAIGVTALTTSVLFSPQLFSWLSIGAGVLVLGVGAYMVVTSLGRRDDHHDHVHAQVTGRGSNRSALALGVSGGLVPCHSALVIMLSALALQQALLGLVLTTVFSVGMAVVIVLVGATLIFGREGRLPQVLAGRAPRIPGAPLLIRFAPSAAALVIASYGVYLILQGILRLR